MTKTQQTEKTRYEASPYWAERKEDRQHRQMIAASAEMEASDDWLDDEEN